MNKFFVRFISCVLCISLLSSSLSVYASSDDTVSSENIDDLISRYSDQIKEQTVSFFDTVQVNVTNVGSLWSGFVSFWKITVGVGAYGWNVTKLVATLSKDFITYLRNNYLWGYTDNGDQNFYIDETSHGGGSRDDIKVNIKLPEFVPSENTYPSTAYEDYIYYIGYRGNFPYNFGDETSSTIQNNVVFSTTPYNSYPADVPAIATSGIVRGEFYSNPVSLPYSSYGVYYRINQDYSDSDSSFIINSFAKYPSYGISYIENGRLYVQNKGSALNSRRAYVQKITNRSNFAPVDEIYYNASFTSLVDYTSRPFYFYGSEFFVNCFGNHYFEVSGHKIIYYQGNFYDVTNSYQWESSINGFSVDLSGFINFNVTNIDNGITNFNNTINNIVNNYNVSPDYLLYILQDYLNEIQNGNNYDDYFADINTRLDLLYEQFQEMQEELQDMSGTLVKIKNYCKSIDTTLTALFNKFDSLFTSNGVFFLDIKLDYLYNHLNQDMTYNTNRLISAIENINISSNGGSSGDINFGDLILDLDVTLNNLFTLNNEQKAELESDIDTIKAPFIWIATLGNNINDLLSSMVRRSAEYSGDSYTNDFSSLDDAFSSSTSENAAVPPGTDNSVPSGSASFSSSSDDNSPKLIIHLGNANSDINYGGDVSVLDFSWYAPYKATVDNVIVIFAWAFFIVIFFRRIPSFLHGEDAKEEG